AAAQIFSAAEGVGTNFKKFAGAMHGMDRAEILMVKKEWKEHYQSNFDGRSIEEYIQKTNELTPEEKGVLIAEMSGDKVKVAQAELTQATQKMGMKYDNEEGIDQALEDFNALKQSKEKGGLGMSADEVLQLENQVAQGERFGGADIHALLADRLGGRDLKLAEAIQSDDQERITAAKIDKAENS